MTANGSSAYRRDAPPALSPHQAAAAYQAQLARLAEQRRPPALPVVPRDYYHFYWTPALRWWRPVLAIVAASVAFIVAGMVFMLPAIVATAALSGSAPSEDMLSGGELHPLIFLGLNLGLAAMIPISMLMQWAFFRQRPGYLSSVTGKLRWGWLLRCLALATLAYGLFAAVALLVSPLGEFRGGRFFWGYLAVMLLTTPLQAAGEEYLTRGLLPRAIAALIRVRYLGMAIGWIVSSSIFMALHGQTDLWLNAFYFAFAMVLCVATWLTGGLAFAIAVHVLNNVLAFLFAMYAGEMDSLLDTAQIVLTPGQIAEQGVVTGLIALAGVAAVWWARRLKLPWQTAPAAAPAGSADA